MANFSTGFVKCLARLLAGVWLWTSVALITQNMLFSGITLFLAVGWFLGHIKVED